MIEGKSFEKAHLSKMDSSKGKKDFKGGGNFKERDTNAPSTSKGESKSVQKNSKKRRLFQEAPCGS